LGFNGVKLSIVGAKHKSSYLGGKCLMSQKMEHPEAKNIFFKAIDGRS